VGRESRDEVLEMVRAELGPGTHLRTNTALSGGGRGGVGQRGGGRGGVGRGGGAQGEAGEEEEEDEELERLKASLAAAGVAIDDEEEWDEDELDELFDSFGDNSNLISRSPHPRYRHRLPAGECRRGSGRAGGSGSRRRVDEGEHPGKSPPRTSRARGWRWHWQWQRATPRRATSGFWTCGR